MKLNNYTVIKELYQSDRSRVYKAIKISDNMPVILKIRNNDDDYDQEYKIGKHIDNPYFPKYIDNEISENKSILVLKDDQMESLSDHIPEDGFDFQQFIDITIEISSAIETLHSLGILHRDINPQNIIISKTLDKIKIIDLDIASRISGEYFDFEPLSSLQGNLHYISPEQTGRVNKVVDFRSDLYSLGITFYHLFTGKRPFESYKTGELLYSQIARIPEPVGSIKKNCPESLSKIIVKLTQKAPENRYHTASGIKKDLIFLRNNIFNEKVIKNFVPGQYEKDEKISLTGKLYGRDKEIKLLKGLFYKIPQELQILLVSGDSGIGKTALIRNLYSEITLKKGLFLSGKFDQMNKNFPYSAFIDVLNGFVRQSQASKKSDAILWKKCVVDSVGEFGKVLTDIVPEFKNILGTPKNIASVSPLETTERRNTVFSKLIKDISAMGQPIVIFIDDLQWADNATLSILESIIETSTKNLQIIFSYRDQEIAVNHPASLFLNKLNEKNSNYTEIHLKELKEDAIDKWLSDILQGNEKYIPNLSKIILNKTEGNPFYIGSFLQHIFDNNLITKKPDNSIVIDLDSISKLPEDENVTEHLIKKIDKLDQKSKNILKKLSIFGHHFTLENITQILGGRIKEHLPVIQSLLNAHLLKKSGKRILFSHDKVQLAAKAMLNKKKARELHLKAALGIQLTFNGRASDDINIESYLYHFNHAEKLINDDEKRYELAELNYKMGLRLKSNAAYQAAEHYLSYAISFLPKKPFETHYSFAINLFTLYGEILFLNTKYNEGEKQFNKVISHASSPLDTSKVFIKQIYHHSAHHNPQKAMDIALYALKTLNISIPKKALKLAIITELIKVKYLLKNHKPQDILNLNETNDAEVVAQLNILAAAIVPAYLAFPDLYPLFTLKMVSISTKMGNTNISPFAWINYGVILCTLGQADLGYNYGKAALDLMEKSENQKLITKLHYMFIFFIHHWKKASKDGLDHFKKSISSGLETGDYEFASYAVNNLMHDSFYNGKSIYKLIKMYPEQHKILKSFNKKHTIYEAKYWNQMLIMLNDENSDGISVKGDILNEDDLLPLLEKNKDYSSLAICKIAKMQNAYLAADYKLAISEQKRTLELLSATLGTVFVPVAHFFIALSNIAYYRYVDNHYSYIVKAKKSFKKLKKWGKDAPDNYLHKAQLIEAELLTLSGKSFKAIKYYEEAIKNAKSVGNNLDLGIAYEQFGRYLLANNFDSLGIDNIIKSITVFKQWGALNKSNRLEKEYIETGLIDEEVTADRNIRTTNTQKLNLNTEALVNTIKILNSEFELNTLQSKLVDAVMQASGATRVVYIHVEQDNLFLKSEKYNSLALRQVEGGGSPIKSENLPSSLIEKCILEDNNYLLENISNNSNSSDIKEKTILIIPLKRSGKTNALIYLENDLMSDAFRKEQIQFLILLAGQASIAIENAILFEEIILEKTYSEKIIHNAPALICSLDNTGTIQFVNPKTEEATGYNSDELIGKNWWELMYPGDEYLQVKKLFRENEAIELNDYEMQLSCKNGTKKYISWSTYIHNELNEKSKILIFFGNDITEQKQSQYTLKENEKRLSMALKSAKSGIWDWNVQNNQVFFDPDYYIMAGYEPYEFDQNYEEWKKRVHPDDIAHCESNVALYLNSKIDEYHVEFRFKTKQNDWMWILGQGRILENDSTGAPLRFTGIHIDITQRKLAEQEIIKSKIIAEQYLQIAAEIILTLDKQGTITLLNESGHKLLGYENTALIGKNWFDTCLPKNHIDSVKKAFSKLMYSELNNVDNYENLVLLKDGSTKTIFWHNTLLKDDNGHIIGTLSSGEDITQRVNTEDALKKSEGKFRSYIENAPIGIFIVDNMGNYLEANKATQDITGYSESELIEMNLTDLVPEKDKSVVQQHFNNVTNIGKANGSMSFVKKDGSINYWSVEAVKLSDNRFLGFVIDITERRKAEESQKKLYKKMQHAQKLESLGVLAGGIAHDFNNILTGILGNAEFARYNLPNENPVIENIKNIEKGALHAADLSKQMLAYSGKGHFVVESLNLNIMIDEMLHMLKTVISKKAILNLNLTDNMPNIQADATQIRQVFMNLITNASEAIGDKSGVIAISTGVMEINKPYLETTIIEDNLEEGFYSYFEVSDTGCGMDKETQSKIFDPFFTTKFTGRGLGMAAVLGIVRGHKGSLKIYSEINKGTTFKILFPCEKEQQSEILVKEKLKYSKNDNIGEGKTILVVDDEEHVRILAKMVLVKKGFNVLLAEDGREGIVVFKNNSKIIDLVILDLTMPHVGGKEAARSMMEIDPQAKIIISSGYNENDIMTQFNGRRLAGFIQKPYGPVALCDKISEILE